MKTDEATSVISLYSGAPWLLCLVVERIGPDLLCRIHGGAEHVGAVTLAQWDGQRAQVDELTVGQHKEGPLASGVALKLCRASQTTVTCLAGIHFDGIDKEQIEQIRDEVYTLSVRAAAQLENLRIAQPAVLQA